uniref:Transposase n=1 Tax=Syphacia muris TaxID=451379 RepID=A0A0N5A898_9BILA
MDESYASQKQLSSVAAATMMLSQCSLRERNEILPGNNCYVRQFPTGSVNGSITSRIQRRNAVGNLFEGIDLAVIKQLAGLNGQKLQ